MGDRRPVGALRPLAEGMALRRWRKRRAHDGAANDLADFGGQRAETEEPAAGHLVRAGRSGVAGVIVHARMFGDAMIDHIGMGQAVGCMVAMAEGKRSRRHDEAKCRERCENDREPEAEPGHERGQHGPKLAFTPLNVLVGSGSRKHWPTPRSIALLERQCALEPQCRVRGGVSKPELNAEVESELHPGWPRLGNGFAHCIILLLISGTIEDRWADAVVLIDKRASISKILDLAEHLNADAPVLGEILIGAPAILKSPAVGCGVIADLGSKIRD